MPKVRQETLFDLPELYDLEISTLIKPTPCLFNNPPSINKQLSLEFTVFLIFLYNLLKLIDLMNEKITNKVVVNVEYTGKHFVEVTEGFSAA